MNQFNKTTRTNTNQEKGKYKTYNTNTRRINTNDNIRKRSKYSNNIKDIAAGYYYNLADSEGQVYSRVMTVMDNYTTQQNQINSNT